MRILNPYCLVVLVTEISFQNRRTPCKFFPSNSIDLIIVALRSACNQNALATELVGHQTPFLRGAGPVDSRTIRLVFTLYCLPCLSGFIFKYSNASKKTFANS